MSHKKSKDEMEVDIPPQHQDRKPGLETEMTPAPVYLSEGYKAAGKLKGKVALITGGDSGIGRSVAILFAHEGADIAIAYLDEHVDAQKTKEEVEKAGRKCLLLPTDLTKETNCFSVVDETLAVYGKLDILVNNAAEQFQQASIEDITEEQLDKTFRTNIYAYFFMVKAALPYLKAGAAIINTASVTAYKGSPQLLDYSATKGAIVAFTRSLSQSLVEVGIRVNAVAPGPIWTPFIPSTFPEEKVSKFGSDVPLKRPGQPFEVATAYVFLASEDSSYIVGQTIHPNGGEVVNG